jgi:hypothetical protein
MKLCLTVRVTDDRGAVYQGSREAPLDTLSSLDVVAKVALDNLIDGSRDIFLRVPVRQCASLTEDHPPDGPTAPESDEPAPIVYRWMADIDLRLPGRFTFESCPAAVAALNAAYGWPGGAAPAPPGLSEATWRARATWKVRLPVALREDGSLEIDAMALDALLKRCAKGA